MAPYTKKTKNRFIYLPYAAKQQTGLSSHSLSQMQIIVLDKIMQCHILDISYCPFAEIVGEITNFRTTIYGGSLENNPIFGGLLFQRQPRKFKPAK